MGNHFPKGQLHISNKDELVSWSKEEISFDDTKNYKSTGTNHLNRDEPILKELVDKIEQGFNNLHNQIGLSSEHKQIVGKGIFHKYYSCYWS